jgi:hypothetical protein
MKARDGVWATVADVPRPLGLISRSRQAIARTIWRTSSGARRADAQTQQQKQHAH